MSTRLPQAPAEEPATPGLREPMLEEWPRLVLDSLPIGLVVYARDLRVLLRNHAATALLADESDISKAISRVAIESGYEDWGAELCRVTDTGVPQRFSVTIRAAEDQPDLYLDLAASPLRAAESGEVVGGLVLIENVSSRISMERRLAVSERLAAVGKLAARVAHELNNPLDGIRRYLNLALRMVGEGDEPKLREYLEKARAGIVRMGDIITTLLEFSRSAPAAFESATINKIVEDAISAMEGRAHEASVTFVCNFHQTEMPVVRSSNVFQVVCNLIKNAVEAMPDGGTLTITTAVVEPDVIVRFEDTGVGLPEQAEKIFEPFFTTKEPGKGTGLGLAVCRELIEKLDGTITAERRRPRGTTMTVRLPIRSCAGTVPPRVAREKRRPMGENAETPKRRNVSGGP